MNQNKQALLDEIHELTSSLEQAFQNSTSIEKLRRLASEIEEDYYTIVVVGEFKNGKSTLINALLGEDLVPRDITPTTAVIHALFYQKQPALQVVYQDNKIEESELSSKTLQRYTASGTYQAGEISHIKVFTPAELLKDRVILVDTPGVNDVNQQRADVTHQFMPKADAVIFLTSLEAGIRKTEAEFLEKYVLDNGSNLIYAANFMDRIDEDDLDETIEFVERRLRYLTKNPNAIIYPLAAKQALEGKLLKDHDLLEESGILEIERAVIKQLEAGVREKQKINRYSLLLANIKHKIQLELDAAETFTSESLENIQERISLIEQWFNSMPTWKKELEQYVYDREADIKYIVSKSLHYFEKKVRQDVENLINSYQGATVKRLVEDQLPQMIKRSFEGWIEIYSPSIEELLRKLEQGITVGLAKSFKQEIKIKANRKETIQLDNYIEAVQVDSVNTNVRAGALVGGLGVITAFMTGGLLVPVITMAGIPFVSEKLAEKQLKALRPEITVMVNEQIDKLMAEFEMNILSATRKNIDTILTESLSAFTQQLDALKKIMVEEAAMRNEEAAKMNAYKQSLLRLRNFLGKREKIEYEFS